MIIEKMFNQLAAWENLKAEVDRAILEQKVRLRDEMISQYFSPMRYWWNQTGRHLYRR